MEREDDSAQMIVVGLITSWILAHNECVRLSSAAGDNAAVAYAGCIISLADAFGMGELPQIQQLRENMGRGRG